MGSEGLLKWRMGTGLALSVGLHVALLLLITLVPPPRLEQPETVSFAVLQTVEEPKAPEPEPEAPEPEPKAPEPEPEPPKPVKPPPRPVKRPRRVVPRAPKEEPPPPSEEPPAPAEESPADFTGLTLTNDGPGEGWVTAVGSGKSMDAPIGTPGAVTGRQRKGVAGGAIDGTGMRVAKLSDLSRLPIAPDQRKLDAVLVRNYPKEAKQRGIEGEAVLQIRVLASGKLRPLKTKSESYPGFAKACRASLREMRFTPGLDQLGKPVATDVPFTCSFTLY